MNSLLCINYPLFTMSKAPNTRRCEDKFLKKAIIELKLLKAPSKSPPRPKISNRTTITIQAMMIIKSKISAKLPVGIKNRIIKNTPANSSHTPMAYTTIRAISPLIILFTATPLSSPSHLSARLAPVLCHCRTPCRK